MKIKDANINKNTCRTLVNQNPQAYFCSITIPELKIRVKIPKLLMRTIQMRKNTHGGGCSDSNETNHDGSKTTKKKKKITCLSSLFSSVCGSKKPLKDEMGHQYRKLPSKFKRHSVKEYSEEATKDDEHKRAKNMLSYIKERVKKNSTYPGSDVETANICSSSSNGDTGGSAGQLPRVPLRKIASERLVGVGGGEAEMGGENRGRTDGCDEELCKKRILMGEKCKPLSYSGTLQYDKEGMPLPDTFLW